MKKTYIVAGASWLAEVEIDNAETMTLPQMQTEATTRAVEALYKKRSDIDILHHEPLKLTQEEREEDELHATLIDLLTNELKPGCGIGMLLCIMDNRDPATYKEGEEYEWYISSKQILANAGLHDLVERFDAKYPDQPMLKNKKFKKKNKK